MMAIRVFLLCNVFGWTFAQHYYDQRYDYYDVDSLLQNQRLLKKYLNCFIDKGPCPPIGREFKAILPEVVRTSCAKCSPRQKRFARRVVNAFRTHFPQLHDELKKKLDPQKKYYEAFEKTIANA